MKIQTAQHLYPQESFMETLYNLLATESARQPQPTVIENEYPQKEDKDDIDCVFGAMIY